MGFNGMKHEPILPIRKKLDVALRNHLPTTTIDDSNYKPIVDKSLCFEDKSTVSELFFEANKNESFVFDRSSSEEEFATLFDSMNSPNSTFTTYDDATKISILVGTPEVARQECKPVETVECVQIAVPAKHDSWKKILNIMKGRLSLK